MKRVLYLVLSSMLAMGAFQSLEAAETDWQIISIDNRDYLSLANVARFYQLKIDQNPVDHRCTLADSRVRIETCANPREIYVNGAKQWLSFPLLVQTGETLISRLDLAKTVEPCLRPTMIGNLSPFHTVVLDAGHGGEDNGSRSVSGQEKEYTLDVIKDLKKSLEAKGLNVVLTRDSDVYLPLEVRADLANHASDSIFVSVHFNSSADASAKGVEVYAMTPCGAASTSDAAAAPDQFKPTPGNDFDNVSLALAACVQHSVLGHMAADTDRGVKRARFAVLRLTHAPAILIEGGFLSNGLEGREIADPAWRETLAEAIATGVRSFQNVAVYKEPPKLIADYRSEGLPGPATFVNPLTLAANVTVPRVRVSPVNNPRP